MFPELREWLRRIFTADEFDIQELFAWSVIGILILGFLVVLLVPDSSRYAECRQHGFSSDYCLGIGGKTHK